MTEDKPTPSGNTPTPASVNEDGKGEMHQVDTKVQEEAAVEREESGGYD